MSTPSLAVPLIVAGIELVVLEFAVSITCVFCTPRLVRSALDVAVSGAEKRTKTRCA